MSERAILMLDRLTRLVSRLLCRLGWHTWFGQTTAEPDFMMCRRCVECGTFQARYRGEATAPWGPWEEWEPEPREVLF